MSFIKKMVRLQNLYSPEKIKIHGNAILYGENPTPPPLADHIFFSPMPEHIISHLVDSYRRKIPDELLSIYRIMNGADLFWTTRINVRLNIRIPLCRFSLFGVPLSNSRENPQPFNISLEDLNRPKNTPESWLKFASYTAMDQNIVKYDMYVDTDSLHTYSVERGSTNCIISQSWNSINECLSALIDSFYVKRDEFV